MNSVSLWNRYKTHLFHDPETGLMVDISRMNFDDGFLAAMEPAMQKAFAEMAALESGAIANPDEGRMVGHYWLRTPSLAPAGGIASEIADTMWKIKEFASAVHAGKITAPDGRPFRNILIVGIGGSALGPQFIADALGSASDPLAPYFLDNTDPDGMDRVLSQIGPELATTMTVVISKSGGTKETRNGMLEAKAAYHRAGLYFPRFAVAVTGAGSELDRTATESGWLARFPMWDWIGGRTSVTSAVGLLPAALQGIDIEGLLEGARLCDALTRHTVTAQNPAALLALMWHHATGGKGARDMVILPYKDRLLLFSRYLQQLIMESIGKELDRDGNVVCQGISVYGNKGSTDQHAYVQQLREGVNNFFVTFIEVLLDRTGISLTVEPGVTSGDYLAGFLQGTRIALSDKGRESITITIPEISARTTGMLIALFERAVGLYSSLININAYHQPGVEAGKKAAGTVLALQAEVITHLSNAETPQTADEIAAAIGHPEAAETIFRSLLHAVANTDHRVGMERATPLTDSRFVIE